MNNRHNILILGINLVDTNTMGETIFLKLAEGVNYEESVLYSDNKES